LVGGIISATTLIGLHYGVAFLTFRSKTLEGGRRPHIDP
jgi:hypothetical protein